MILKPKPAALLWALTFALSALTVSTLSPLFWISTAAFAAVNLHMARHHKYYDRALDDDSDRFTDDCEEEEGGTR